MRNHGGSYPRVMGWHNLQAHGRVPGLRARGHQDPRVVQYMSRESSLCGSVCVARHRWQVAQLAQHVTKPLAGQGQHPLVWHYVQLHFLGVLRHASFGGACPTNLRICIKTC